MSPDRTRRQIRAQLLSDLLASSPVSPITPTHAPTHTVTLISAMGQERTHDIYVNPPPPVLHVQGIVYEREGSRIRGKLIYRESEDERPTPDEMGQDPTSS